MIFQCFFNQHSKLIQQVQTEKQKIITFAANEDNTKIELLATENSTTGWWW